MSSSISGGSSELNSQKINKKYGFSNTSSELINISKKNLSNSETQYDLNSSSVNTSDINLVSVDSYNGKRYL